MCAASGEFVRDVTGRRVPGREVGRNEYLHHHRQEMARTATSTANKSVPLVSPIAPTEAPLSNPGQDWKSDHPNTDTNVANLETHCESNTLSLNAAENLSSVMRELRLRSREFKDYESPLVFRHPPSSKSEYFVQHDIELVLNGGPLPLQPHVLDNSSFLDYQTWLLEAYYIVEALFEEDVSPEFHERRENGMKALVRELEHLEQLKVREWTRQVDAARAPQRPEGDSSVIDFGKYQCRVCMDSSNFF
jgi:hypothetical protein